MNGRNIFALLLVGGGLWSLTALDRASPAPEAGDMLAPTPMAGPGELVVDYVDDTDADAILDLERGLGLSLDWASVVSEDEALRAGAVGDVADALARLAGNPLVEVAEPVVVMEALGYPNDPHYKEQWNFEMIGVPIGWRVGGGAGVTVAVIDTGVTAVPDLNSANILPGRSFVPGTRDASDDHGHGTHVAGTIAQATNNGRNVTGIAPRATILPIKVLSGSGMGTSAWIAAGIDEAVDQGAQVINLSLGGGHSAVVVNAVEKARKAGVIVVAAAGNAGREGLGSPADAPSAIAVSAVGPDDALAPYSSWGKGVELSAPGGNKNIKNGGIFQETIDPKSEAGGLLAEYQGTSMASPHVAGAAAVLLGAGAPSADEVERLLKTTAVEKGDPLHYGAGRLDLGAAVRALLFGHNAVLFGAGALVAWGLSLMGAVRGGARWVAVLTAGVVAGGLFVLPFLGLPPTRGLELLGKPLLTWLGAFWSGFPLWQSALLPLIVTVLLAPFRRLGLLALSLCAGVGTYLLYGAATGHTDVWWLPLNLDRWWLALNGTVSLLLGMAAAGAQKLHREKR